jgi:regulator of protease activity HflC (stomatin/prohibitin superfamily)
MIYTEDKPNIVVVGGIVIIALAVSGVGIWARPQLGVYYRTMAGKAALMEAESTRQVRVLEAKAKMDSASLEANAEIERAKGVAEANRIIGDSLKDNPRYLQYLYITGLQEGSEKGNRTIYVPTEGGLPVPTLGIEK